MRNQWEGVCSNVNELTSQYNTLCTGDILCLFKQTPKFGLSNQPRRLRSAHHQTALTSRAHTLSPGFNFVYKNCQTTPSPPPTDSLRSMSELLLPGVLMCHLHRPMV